MTNHTTRRICLIVNEGSGRLKREPAALDAVTDALGDRAETRFVAKGKDIAAVARQAVDDGFDVVVPVGGDGTIMTVAGVLADTGTALGVLPMGTFNFFARGLGIPDDPGQAAEVLTTGRTQEISVGEVNGRIFLNNASLGVYPKILRARETIYRRFGRRRIAAYWSVIKTFARFQSPLRLSITAEDQTIHLRTPLLFIARSAFQLEEYQLAGADCLRNDAFAIFAAPDGARRDLFVQAWRLIRRNMQPGQDFTLMCHRNFTVTSGRKKVLVACDGEKFIMRAPLHFQMLPDALRVIVPDGIE